MGEPRDRIYYNKIMDKSAIKQLIGRLIAYRGSVYTAHILDQIKTLGFQRSTQIGFSLGIDDLLSSPLKTWIIQDAEHEAIISQKHNRHGCIHAVERLRQTVETWHTTSEFLKREMTISFNMLDSFNPVHMMSFSGARGNTSQVHQLVGMRGLMSDPQGNIIDLPIQNNLREGLSLTEYIISCYGARKGVVDTAIRTADAGYLTRRLVQVAQHLVVRNVDCGTPWGVYLRSIRARQATNFWSQNRLVGRVLARPVCLEKRCLASRNQDIDANLANHLIATYTHNILVRSPLACKNTEWACQLCYGWGGSSNKMVELGEAVGIIAGQSIGEPGTQLTLRTFHTGGVFTGDIANQIRAPLNGIACFDSRACRSTRNRHGRLSWKCFQDLAIVIEGQNTNHTLTIPAHSLLLINNNQYVESKQVIAEVRATVAPLKETVQRHIYSHLQGEVMHTTSVRCLSTALDNNCYFNDSNNVHLWVWSGQMSEIGGYKIFSVFQSEDYIQINTPVNKQNSFPSLGSKLHKNKIILKSLLVGSFSYFRQIKNKHTGTIRIIFRKKATDLSNLILSRLNQFNMSFHKRKTRVQKKLFYNKTIFRNINNIYKFELINWLIFYAQYSYFIVLKKNEFYTFVKTHNLLTTNCKYHYHSIGLIGFFKYPLQYCYKYLLETDKKFALKNYNIASTYIYKHILKRSLFCKIINEHKIVYCLTFFNTILLYAQFSNTIYLNIFSYLNQLPQLGQLIWNNIFLEPTGRILESGKIVCILKQNIIFRLIHPFLLASGAMIHVNCYDIIHEGDMLITLMYEQLKTSDIVQGLPKAEQLLEARSMNEIVLKLENDFLSLTEYITRQLSNSCKTYNVNTRNSLKHSQLELVNRIQTVYLSQGVRILDKHIEVIVRQMSSKVMLIENVNPLSISFGGLICLPIPHMKAFVSQNWIEIPIQYAIDNYAFLPGEIIELVRAQKMHYVLTNPIAHKPMLLGITKASLTTKSFLAEASFQRTARVLSKSALQGRVDWIQGLQENILFGEMIPAGTGCEKIFSKLSFLNEVIKEQHDPLILFTNKLINSHNSSQTRNLGRKIFANTNKKIAEKRVKHYLVSKFVQPLFQYSSIKSVYDLQNVVNIVSLNTNSTENFSPQN